MEVPKIIEKKYNIDIYEKKNGRVKRVSEGNKKEVEEKKNK